MLAFYCSLEAYDRNDNFGHSDLIDDQDVYSMSVPSLTEFRDATTKNTKGVQYSSAVMFFNSVDSSLSSGNRLYKERYVISNCVIRVRVRVRVKDCYYYDRIFCKLYGIKRTGISSVHNIQNIPGLWIDMILSVNSGDVPTLA